MPEKPNVALWNGVVFVHAECDKVLTLMRAYATRYAELSEEHWYAICPNMTRIRRDMNLAKGEPLDGREVEDFLLRKYVGLDGTLQVNAKF